MKLQERFLNMSLHSRLLTYFVLVSIIPILIIGIVSYRISFHVVREMAVKSSENMIDRVNSETDKLLLDAFKNSEMIAGDPSIQQILRRPIEEDVEQRYSTDLMMDTRLGYIQSYRNDLFGFYVIGESGGKYKSNYRSLKSDEFRGTDWYKKITSSDGPVWFEPHIGSFVAETTGQSLISVGYPIKDKATGNIIGAVLIDVEESMITDIINSRLVKTGYILMLDKDNNILLYPNGSAKPGKPHELETIAENMKKHEERFYENNFGVRSFGGYNELPLIVYKESALTGWKIVGAIPSSELIKDSARIGYIIAAMLLIISIIAFIAAWNIAGTVAKPIKKMIFLMKKVEEGDLSVSMNVRYGDEIGKLGNSFNVMIGEIKNLMERVYYEQNELRKAELKVLQAQINPHFLYNTLESIIWMSRENQNEDVIRMVTSLTKLFRISLSRGKDIITIENEVRHVESYLTIQYIRYKNKFTYEIQVPENLFKYKTLKLILQPLVENAIYHGVKGKREKGHISILGREEEEFIVLEVKDTGIGMTVDQLEALQNTLQNREGKKLDSYGLKNVSERLRIFFGSNHSFNFYSVWGIGTSVEIKIPKMLEAD